MTAIVRSPGPQNKVEAQSLLLTTENTIASTQSCFDVSFFCDKKSELVHFGLPSNSTAYASWSDAKSKCIATNHPTWAIWWSIDKRKTISWIAPLLSVRPDIIGYIIGYMKSE